MNRRKYLATLGVLGSGAAAAMGTGAFTSTSATRDVTVTVADDTDGYLGFSASPDENGEFASVDTSSGGDGEIALDFGTSDGGGSGVGLNSTYDFDDVFRLENQGTQTIYVWANFSGEDLDNDDIWFYPESNSGRRLNDGNNSVVTLTTGQQVNVGVHIDTSEALSSTDDQALTATLTADVDVPSNSQPSGPVGEDAAVVSKDPDTGEFDSIQGAIDAVDGTRILVEPGTYDESVTIDVDGLTLEGPNAGTPGDSDQRSAEATITGGVFVDGNPSDVVIDGFAIERTVGEAEGVVQIGSTSNPGASNLTIRNNVITATSNGPQNLGTILIEQIDGEVRIEDNLLTQTGDGSGNALVRGLVQAVQLENTAIVADGNAIETDVGLLLSGQGLDGGDGPSPEYTITNNEFVENDRLGVDIASNYDGEVEISGNTFEDGSVQIRHLTGATTNTTIESNTFTQTESGSVVAFVSDRRGGDGSTKGLDRNTIQNNNIFNPGSTQVGPISFDNKQLFDIAPP